MLSVRREHDLFAGRRQQILGRLLPHTSPATYGILGFSCLLYAAQPALDHAPDRISAPGGGVFGIFNLGGINGDVLQRLGASLPLAYTCSSHGDLSWLFFCTAACCISDSICGC